MILDAGEKDSDPEVKNLQGKGSGPVSLDLCCKEGKRMVHQMKSASRTARIKRGLLQGVQ